MNTLVKLFGSNKKRRITLEERQRIAFQRKAREQFLKLKKKGLGITVMSL